MEERRQRRHSLALALAGKLRYRSERAGMRKGRETFGGGEEVKKQKKGNGRGENGAGEPDETSRKRPAHDASLPPQSVGPLAGGNYVSLPGAAMAKSV